MVDMSTSADSAQTWLTEQKPSIEAVRQMLQKLQGRLDRHQGKDVDIQGSVEALRVLQQHLNGLQSVTEPVNLKAAPLIPEAEPVILSIDQKKAAFAALKAQFDHFKSADCSPSDQSSKTDDV